MKSLFERLFKKEPQFSYTIADYQPIKTNRLRTDVTVTEYQVGSATEKDEMDIDKIYQSY
jgi:hypothetical protein